MRDAFSDALVRIATRDRNVLLLTGDHGYALFDTFREACSDQYINAGIAEQNMVGMAAGLARAGFRPFVYGLSAFVPVRVLEQIKLDVAHDDLPVVFVGDGAGFVYSHLGTSHQSTEDIACTRAIPNLRIFSPADRFEVTLAMEAAYAAAAPVYFRMGKSDRGDVHAGPVDAPVGAPAPVISGEPGGLAFLATGSMARTAADLIASDFPGASLCTVPWIRPLDEAEVIKVARAHRAIVVFEEHSVYGGLGSLIAEITSTHHPLPVLRIGVQDRFSEHCGTYNYLLVEHGLDAPAVRDRILAFDSALAAR